MHAQSRQLHPTGSSELDFGFPPSECRVSQKKLLFLHYLVNLDQGALDSEVFTIQRYYNLPGLVKEGRKLLKYFNLPNIIDMEATITQLQWKHKVRGAIISKYEDILESEMSRYSNPKEGLK